MQSAIECWQDILDARARQMDAAYARLGRTSADFWNRRARNYHRATKDAVARDPLFLKLSREITPQTTVLDVGAGTGRFALALAPQAKHVTTVEPNAAMLNYLREDAAQQGLTNVAYVQTSWQEAPTDLVADIVVCSHVLYPIRDVVPFLEKLKAATRHACYIYLRASSLDALFGHIWQHFHGEARCFPPGYIDALAVMYDMGIYANVEVVTLPNSMRYSSLDTAVEELMEQLILLDDEHTRGELRSMLDGWLVTQEGMLTPPTERLVCGIIEMLP